MDMSFFLTGFFRAALLKLVFRNCLLWSMCVVLSHIIAYILVSWYNLWFTVWIGILIHSNSNSNFTKQTTSSCSYFSSSINGKIQNQTTVRTWPTGLVNSCHIKYTACVYGGLYLNCVSSRPRTEVSQKGEICFNGKDHRLTTTLSFRRIIKSVRWGWPLLEK